MALIASAVYLKMQLNSWDRFLGHLDTALIRVISSNEIDSDVEEALPHIFAALTKVYQSLTKHLFLDPRKAIVDEEYSTSVKIIDMLEVYNPRLNERLEASRKKLEHLQKQLKLLPHVPIRTHMEARLN